MRSSKKGKRADGKCSDNRGRKLKTESSKVKEYLKSCESRTYEALAQAITEAIDLVTQDNLIGWFTHCCSYFPPN